MIVNRANTRIRLLFYFWFCTAGVNVAAEAAKISGDPEIIPNNARLETLWEKGGFTEGAAVAPDGLVYFSDFAQPFDARPARIMKFNPYNGQVTVHTVDSKMANGLMFDRHGRLFACCASPLGGKRALVEAGPRAGRRFR